MRRMTRHLPWAAGFALVLAHGLRLRSRVSQLPVLDDATTVQRVGRVPTGPGHLVDTPGTGYGVIRAPGVEVDDRTHDAAVRHARAHDLDVLELIPGNLHLERLHELVRAVDPATYRKDRLAAGRGAGHATLVRTRLLDELSLRPSCPLDPVEYAEVLLKLKSYAPTSTDLVVAPRLRAVPVPAEWRLPRLRVLYGSLAPAVALGPAVRALLVSAGPLLSRRRGAAGLAAYCAQPLLLAWGGPVKPCDLELRTTLGRGIHDLRTAVRSFRLPSPPAVQHQAELEAGENDERRRQYARSMERASGFLEPPRTACPWCGGDDLCLRVEVPDLLQRKPGRFRMDECRSCGHVFQNPRLSIVGLDFYYRDFYDGLGQHDTEFVFSTNVRSYRGRAKLLQGVAEPKRWLDVGAGHGHFCLVAQELWPETVFDGLDFGDSIVAAERRGWIDRAYKGLFPDFAPEMVGAYDVVSMHHYLEHTREPAAELDAAHLVLQEGGHLLVEVPDPESRLGRALGWAWGPLFQPQHQHLLPLANLTAALEERGFSVVAVERGAAHLALDFALAAWLIVNRIAPPGDRPWNPPPTVLRRAGRAAIMTVAAPVMAGALVTDQLVAPVLRRLPRMTNAYRVLARKD